MKAYKVFNPDMTCKGFQYEIGKTYKHDGDISLYKSGFHACLNAVHCFNYYKFDKKNIMCEVFLSGDIQHGQNKSVCSEIKIVRQIRWEDILNIVNIGNGNSGNGNSGNRNSGDYNSGNRNSGNRNSGDYNSGDYNSGYYNSGYRNSGNNNSGDYNSGYRNSGNRNSGDYNSGNGNSGDYNSGDYNKCDFESGFFNSDDKKTIRVFNKELEIDRDSFLKNDGMRLCNKFYIRHYHRKLYGKKIRLIHTYKNSWRLWYNERTNKELELVKSIPGFDSDVFYDITGVKI